MRSSGPPGLKGPRRSPGIWVWPHGPPRRQRKEKGRDRSHRPETAPLHSRRGGLDLETIRPSRQGVLQSNPDQMRGDPEGHYRPGQEAGHRHPAVMFGTTALSFGGLPGQGCFDHRPINALPFPGNALHFIVFTKASPPKAQKEALPEPLTEVLVDRTGAAESFLGQGLPLAASAKNEYYSGSQNSVTFENHYRRAMEGPPVAQAILGSAKTMLLAERLS